MSTTTNHFHIYDSHHPPLPTSTSTTSTPPKPKSTTPSTPLSTPPNLPPPLSLLPPAPLSTPPSLKTEHGSSKPPTIIRDEVARIAVWLKGGWEVEEGGGGEGWDSSEEEKEKTKTDDDSSDDDAATKKKKKKKKKNRTVNHALSLLRTTLLAQETCLTSTKSAKGVRNGYVQAGHTLGDLGREARRRKRGGRLWRVVETGREWSVEELEDGGVRVVHVETRREVVAVVVEKVEEGGK